MSLLAKYGITKGDHDEEACYILALIYNVIHDDISTYLNQFDLSVGKFNILVALQRNGGTAIKQVDISKHLIVSPSNMTKLIDKLEVSGFVTRTHLEGDRRVKLINITKNGLSLVEKIWEGHQKIIISKMKGFTPSDRKNLSALLTQWLGLLEKQS
ncbi:MAG: MarR family winged helix-turn-helix transcriptional regulator [Gammaproteobacteria bacterium]